MGSWSSAVLLLLLCCLVGDVCAGVRGPRSLQDARMPPPARAHCRVFVVAAAGATRLLVLRNAYEQDVVDVYDHREALESVLGMGAEADADEEKRTADEAYRRLGPAFEQAAQWLKPWGDARQCFAHFVAPATELAGAAETGQGQEKVKVTVTTSRVKRRLDQLRDRARRDGKFPFALTEPTTERRDADSVAASGELQLVNPTWRRYFQVVGTNYFAGRVAPSLSPGQIEVFGLLHVDDVRDTAHFKGETDSAEMVFDVRGRWRRSKRQRQVSVALNTSDFYSRGYAGFGRQGVQQAVLKLQQERAQQDVKSDLLLHPCFLRDYSASVAGLNVTLAGAGDADQCMSLIRTLVASSNTNCPPENFCVLGGAPQPQPFGSFYASGVLREAVLSASRILDYVSQRQENAAQLQLPTPSLVKLRAAANTLCALTYAEVVTSEKSSSAETSALVSAKSSALCLDMCYTTVLLEQVGVQDVDERVHFVDHFEKQAVLSGHGSDFTGERGSPPELVAWLTGAFLYLEALQRKVTFSIESELLAEQLSAGLPLGWNMSLVVFVAAFCFLYLTTGRVAITGRAGRSANGYHRVVNGDTKAKFKDTTQSIVFVDDARE